MHAAINVITPSVF